MLHAGVVRIAAAAVAVLCGCDSVPVATSSFSMLQPSPTSVSPTMPPRALRCGRFPPPSASGGIAATLVPAAGQDAIVTEDQSETTVFLVAPQRLVVELGTPEPGSSLSPGPLTPQWTEPEAADPHGPLTRDAGQCCADGSAFAIFTANGSGATSVTATTDFACLHTVPPCELGQMEIEFFVVVRRSNP